MSVKSRYALKQTAPVVRDPAQHRRRECDGCGRKLARRRGHGFPSHTGTRVLCDYCTFPKLAPPKGRIEIPFADAA